MNPMLTRRRFNMLLLAQAVAGVSIARADEFPARSLRLLVPTGAGSGGDVIMRVLAAQLAAQLKQPVIVDNRPGADGLIAMQGLMSAPADGYTLLLIGPQPMVFNPLLRNDLPYKVSDLRPVVGVVRGWTVLATGPNSKFASYEDLVAAARKQREAVTMGTDGLSYRVGATLLSRRIGAEFRHVPYKVFTQVLTDLTNNALDVALVNAAATVPLVNAGKLRVLAAASKERLLQLPQVPTVRERGTDFDLSLWTALAVRTGTPEPALRRLEADLLKALASDEFRALVAKLATLELSGGTAQAVAAEIAADTARYRDIAREIAAEQAAEKR